MNFYIYKITYYCEGLTETDKFCTGIVAAESFSNAVQVIENYYGEDLVSINGVDRLNYDCDSLLELPLNLVFDIHKEVNK